MVVKKSIGNESSVTLWGIVALVVASVYMYWLFVIGVGLEMGGGNFFNDSEFVSRVLGPLMTVAIFAMLLWFILSRSTYDKSSFRSIILILCKVLAFSPGVILFLYSMSSHFLPEQTHMKYFEGYTVEACETGEPAVFWGQRPFRRYSCLEFYGLCDEIENQGVREGCYAEHGMCDKSEGVDNKDMCYFENRQCDQLLI